MLQTPSRRTTTTSRCGLARAVAGAEPLSYARHSLVASLALLAFAGGATAQEKPVSLAAFFWHDAPNDEAAFEGIERGLRAAGITAEWMVRRAGSDPEIAVRQLGEIGSAAPRLVFAMGTQAALLAREHLRGVPIVFTAVTNPVESGVAASWTSAGPSLCGTSNWIAPERVLQSFLLAVPTLTRLGILRSTTSGVVSAAELRQMQRHLREPAAPPVQLVEALVERAEDIPAAVARLRGQGVQAVWVPIDHVVYQDMSAVAAALRDSGVALLTSAQRGVEAGAVAGVVVDYVVLGERAAAMARTVLAGKAKPEDLAIGTLQSCQLVVNLAMAKTCAYELPLGALLVADRILDRIEEKR